MENTYPACKGKTERPYGWLMMDENERMYAVFDDPHDPDAKPFWLRPDERAKASSGMRKDADLLTTLEVVARMIRGEPIENAMTCEAGPTLGELIRAAIGAVKERDRG